VKNVYQDITNRITELLDQGVIPWRKPWNGQGARNLVSDKAYRGMNTILLNAAPYASPYWLTYNQAKARGGHVRKGERGWPIVYWEKLVKTGDDGEVTGTIPLLKSWTVFNVTQCEGIESPALSVPTFQPIDAAERILIEYRDAPPVFFDGSDACYRPGTDTIYMPTWEQFESPESFYSTWFHEAGHSTGHPKRLNRPGMMESTYGTDLYSKEELVAEMAAAMLCGVTGIAPKTVENSAAYIGGWLSVLKSDRKILAQAAAAAQKAADYIRGIVSEAD